MAAEKAAREWASKKRAEEQAAKKKPEEKVAAQAAEEAAAEAAEEGAGNPAMLQDPTLQMTPEAQVASRILTKLVAAEAATANLAQKAAEVAEKWATPRNKRAAGNEAEAALEEDREEPSSVRPRLEPTPPECPPPDYMLKGKKRKKLVDPEVERHRQLCLHRQGLRQRIGRLSSRLHLQRSLRLSRI